MRIPLSLDVSYLPSWSVKEGLRELLQNWADSNDTTGVTGAVVYSTSNGGTMVLTNPGADMTRDAMLLGGTTKLGDDTKRGHFGEGLKLGVLALVRSGKGVRIETTQESWTAKLEEHDQFPGRQVLVFHTRALKASRVGVIVEVTGVTREEYEEARGLFLSFQTVEKKLSEPYHGEILMDAAMKGRVFVKGILVNVDPRLAFGYNLFKAKTDRDRKMVDQWDLQYAAAAIIASSMTGAETFRLLENEAPETEYLKYHSAGDKLKAEFHAKYGTDAMPCASLAEASDLEHSGVKGIPVPKNLLTCLVEAGLDAKKQADENVRVPKRIVALQDMTVQERASLQWAVLRTAAALGSDEASILSRMRVVEFKTPSLLGLYRAGSVDVSCTLLWDRFELLAALLHEFSHDAGGDGEFNHIATLEKLWTKVVRQVVLS